jgi:DNA-binding beta-propeller fold protein YncE
MISRRIPLAILLLILFALAPAGSFAQTASASASAPSAFHIADEWKLGGPGGWGPLLFDAKSNRLYVPRTSRVAVLDATTGKLLGEVQGFVDARYVALDSAGRFGYVTDIMDGTVGNVRVFDCSTFQLVASIVVDRIPGAIVFDPVTKMVFAFSFRGRNAAVIDPATNTVVATIALPGKPHLAVTDGRGTIFASFRGIGKLVRIDTASRKLTADWPTDPCAEFRGLTFDAAHRQLLASCNGQQMIAVNADSGQVTAIGQCQQDATDLVFDAGNRLLFSASSSGRLNVYRQDSATQYTNLNAVATAPRAGTIAEDPGKARVYLVTADFAPRKAPGPGMEEMEARLTPVLGSFRVIVVSR